MPLANRVTPRSELIAHPGRGLVYGNRGCLHDMERRIRRRYAGRRWISCRLEFRNWQRQPLMQPGTRSSSPSGRTRKQTDLKPARGRLVFYVPGLMVDRLRAGAIAGVLAPFVFLLGAVVISWLETDFMEELGWEVWPSGLALGPHGWLQIVNFVALGVLLIAFALGVNAVRAQRGWTKAAPALLALAGVAAVMLVFKTDPPDQDESWHGLVHGWSYVVWLVALVVSYPITWWRVRRHEAWQRSRWAGLLALLLFPPVLLLPDSESAGNYVFFAVVLAPLAAIATRLAAGSMGRPRG